MKISNLPCRYAEKKNPDRPAGIKCTRLTPADASSRPGRHAERDRNFVTGRRGQSRSIYDGGHVHECLGTGPDAVRPREAGREPFENFEFTVPLRRIRIIRTGGKPQPFGRRGGGTRVGDPRGGPPECAGTGPGPVRARGAGRGPFENPAIPCRYAETYRAATQKRRQRTTRDGETLYGDVVPADAADRKRSTHGQSASTSPA